MILQSAWRPLTAATYLLVTIFDFIIMPIAVETQNRVTIDYQLLDNINKLSEPQTQIEIARKMDVAKRTWQPLTLQGGGLVHIAFGSILTGAAVTRGMEKTAQVKAQTPG